MRGPLRASWWLIGLVLLAGVGCQQTPEARKQKAVERGRGYLEAGKLGEAVIEFRNALGVDPDFVAALHPLGLAYTRKAWYFDAVRELSRARRVAPDSLPIATDLGRALVEIGAWAEAAEQADFILSRQPDNPHALYIRAAALLGSGKAAEALAVVERAPTTGPLSDLEATRGEALLSLGRLDEAERAFRAAVGRNPGDAKSLSGLGAVSLERKDYPAAVALYEQGKKIEPEQPRIRLGLAVARARLGKLSDAIRELEELDPRARLPEVVMTLALYHLRARKPEEAIAILAPLVRQLPRLSTARLLLANALVDAERPEEAALELDELAALLPGEVA
ncbi:MAG: tetratricopeptide repeat protein, partial [Candidatus Rokubacteria bacterium]|nr:tetratricopeptide repeat protein [Candidatus Rokubacteria bacterium]